MFDIQLELNSIIFCVATQANIVGWRFIVILNTGQGSVKCVNVGIYNARPVISVNSDLIVNK